MQRSASQQPVSVQRFPGGAAQSIPMTSQAHPSPVQYGHISCSHIEHVPHYADGLGVTLVADQVVVGRHRVLGHVGGSKRAFDL
jgi:hypothetical protein